MTHQISVGFRVTFGGIVLHEKFWPVTPSRTEIIDFVPDVLQKAVDTIHKPTQKTRLPNAGHTKLKLKIFVNHTPILWDTAHVEFVSDEDERMRQLQDIVIASYTMMRDYAVQEIKAFRERNDTLAPLSRQHFFNLVEEAVLQATRNFTVWGDR